VIPQPNRALGILRTEKPPGGRVADRFAEFLVASFDALKYQIKRHEQTIVQWR
jgi:hypothetical protein